jgi:hypothetical protein
MSPYVTRGFQFAHSLTNYFHLFFKYFYILWYLGGELKIWSPLFTILTRLLCTPCKLHWLPLPRRDRKLISFILSQEVTVNVENNHSN